MLSSSIAFAQNLDAIKAGVVKITTKTGQVGTGFIIRLEPEVVYIITAAHVIAGDNQPEWVKNWYAENYYKASPEKNPMGPSNGKSYVLRGGSLTNAPFRAPSAYRYGFAPTYRIGHIGFRCAQDAP